MKILSIPLLETFTIEDEDGDVTVTVRQATEMENIERSDLYRRREQFVETGEGADVMKIVTEINNRKVFQKEAYLTLASIEGIVDEKGTEWFRSADGPDGPRISNKMTEKAFGKAWGRLPSSVVGQIIGFVWDVNKDWDRRADEGE